MRLSLIRPKSGNTLEPPLGILGLATYAEQYNHIVQVLDPSPNQQGITEKISQFRPDLIGISMLTTQVARGSDLIWNIKSACPETPIIAGGIHPTALPEWTLRKLPIDYVARGEGEHTLIELMDALQTGQDPLKVPGISGLKDSKYIAAPDRELIMDLDTIPIANRKLVDFNRYLQPPGKIRGKFFRRATSIITSRGCPFGCIFCSSHCLFGRNVRRRSISHIMSEIDFLISSYDIDALWFLDDTLLESPDWLTELCSGIKTRGIPWSCQAHVRRADEGLFRIMKDSGCLQIEFGVESGSARMLQRLRKGSDPDDIRRAFQICRKLGIRTLANFMIGIPDETEADAEASIRLAREIKPSHVVVTFTTPLPGSDLYTEAIQKKWIPKFPEFSKEWTIRQTENPLVAISLNAKTMKKIRKKFCNEFFWTNIRDYFLYPKFVLEVMWRIFQHPFHIFPGLKRTLRTGRLDHLVETVWEELHRVY